jgi:hypothetical protein
MERSHFTIPEVLALYRDLKAEHERLRVAARFAHDVLAGDTIVNELAARDALAAALGIRDEVPE